MTRYDLVCVIIKKFGLASIAIFLLLYILLHPEKVYFLSSKFYRLLSFLGSLFGKKAVSARMEGVILSAAKKLTNGCELIDPYKLKIEWVKSTTKEVFSNRNQIIVRMNEKEKWDSNIVFAVHAYAKRGFIPKARAYMSQELDTSVNMVLTNRIIAMCSNGSLREFYDNIYSIYKKDPRIDLLFNGLLRTDRNGIFTRIYLNEVSKLSYLLGEFAPNAELSKEIMDFTNYIISIASRQIGDQTQLIFNENLIHVGVVLPSSFDYGESDIRYGARRVDKLFSKGCKTVYILAIGSKVELANGIRKLIEENPKFIRVSKSDYYKHIFDDGHYKWAICIELQPMNVMSDSELLELKEKKKSNTDKRIKKAQRNSLKRISKKQK